MHGADISNLTDIKLVLADLKCMDFLLHSKTRFQDLKKRGGVGERKVIKNMLS